MRHTRSRWLGLALIGVIAVLVIVGLTAHGTIQAQTGGTLGYGSKVYGTIAAESPLVTYTFSGSSGDFVTATADTWTGTLDIQLDLVAPNGLILDSSRQNTFGGDAMGAAIAVVVPETGIYLLRLSGENSTTGDFLLTLFGRAAATATPLLYGQAVDVTIPQDAQSQFFTFEAENCPTTLVVKDLSEDQAAGFPFVVKVRDQRGQTVALLRGGDQYQDWVTVEALSGRYEVEVLAADPAREGKINLLVTCSGGAPGCAAGQAAETGIPVCTPCPGPEELVPGGGCPDLHLTAQHSTEFAGAVTVTWDAMPGADGYTVYVRGLTTDGGEVYLTHADWVPGNPLQFTWILPTEGYTGYRFTLEVLIGGEVVCTQQVTIDIEQTSPDCPDLGLTVTAFDPATHTVALGWFGLEEIAGYEITMYGTAEGGAETLVGSTSVAAGVTTTTFTYPDGYIGFRFVLRIVGGPVECSDEITLWPQNQPQVGPCAIRTDRANVEVRVGPGPLRSVFTYLPVGQDIPVIGQAVDEEGRRWWQIDKTVIPGSEGVISLWVAEGDVTSVGNCTEIPQGEIPPVIPDDGGDEGPGTWLPCGSCDTCGHPANECLTSPEGDCLWDPATCVPTDDGDGGEPTGECYAISATVDMGECRYTTASAMLDIAPNCGSGQYSPGTTINAHAVAVDPKCTVKSWSGCGASGSGSDVSFTATSSCTLTAHMGY